MRLNAQSQPTTNVGVGKVEGWMFPLILEDLTKGDLAAKNVTSLSKDMALMRMRHTADSTIIAGLRIEKGQEKRRIETLIDSSARGWQMADYWQKRYKKASTERWLWRLGAGGLIYLKAKGL